jgi:hypothetical protein
MVPAQRDGCVRAGISALSLNVKRPNLRAVDHAKDTNGFPVDLVSHEVRCSLNDEFAGAGYTTGTPCFWKLAEHFYRGPDSVVDEYGSSWVVSFDVVVDVSAIRDCVTETTASSSDFE